MTHSRRWLDANSDADETERSILRAGLGGDPPRELADAVLSRVLAAVAPPIAPDATSAGGTAATPAAVPLAAPPAAGSAAAAGAAVKVASTFALLSKGFAAGVGVSLAIAGGQHWVSQRQTSAPPSEIERTTEPRPPGRAPSFGRAQPHSSPAVPNEPIAPKPAPAAPEAAEIPKAAAAPRSSVKESALSLLPATPAAAAFPSSSGAVSNRASQLQEEAALLKAAREQLRRGALAAAFATLETSRQRFSASELGQEREALTVELLYRSGQRAAAATRARAFLSRYPESPHRDQVREFAK